MRFPALLLLALLAGCAPSYRGVIHDPPDTSRTNAGASYMGKDGYLHVRPGYTVDPMTPEQHAAARAAHDAHYARVNAEQKAKLAAMTPEERHRYICANLAADAQTAAGMPDASLGDPSLMDPLLLYKREGCDR